jgi:hypothetical protein
LGTPRRTLFNHSISLLKGEEKEKINKSTM